MLIISKIKLHNFKRFKDLALDVNPDINIFVGDNESGKSTIPIESTSSLFYRLKYKSLI